ncbi:MAG: helix-turn-helix domain-containing protein [Bacteroidetes bacterium]|nr:helix-turn-helix domain-containing protein [Bacteroidota bacterium]
MAASVNHETPLKLAEDFVNYTNTHIFLTGRAGTGKTTFLRSLSSLTAKRFVVLAPTGVAAINAGGQTIHSFFQLPLGPIPPGTALKRNDPNGNKSFGMQMRKSKLDLIRSLDLIVIDEISMVRADLLDAIDEVLRHYRKDSQPFGGVQLLMIGDLLQLPPIVKNEDWELLRAHYSDLFFFNSIALSQSRFVTITLEKVFRQTDDRFIAILNAVRGGNPSKQVLDELNQRFNPDMSQFETEGYITLTTHNRMADEINQSRLAAIRAPVSEFNAKIKGDFPEHIFPTQQVLELKPGAQVMFVKNDPGPEKQYYNGLIGKVVHIDEDDNTVEVACEGISEPISARPIEWQNIVYDLDPETKNVSEKVMGTFAQLPLRLAWAVTIHKSQGLTFDKVIIDAAQAFAHGQVYVALSRCRSLEGLVFKSSIPAHAIISQQNINNWLDEQKLAMPGPSEFEAHNRAFVGQLLTALFSFGDMLAAHEQLLRLARRNSNSLMPGLAETLAESLAFARNHLEDIGKKFEPQLNYLVNKIHQPSGEQALKERLKQAATYFKQQLEIYFKALPEKIETDDKMLQKSIEELQKEIRKAVHLKQTCLTQLEEGFNLGKFLRVRALAVMETPSRARRESPQSDEESSLLKVLLKWRREEAQKRGLEPSKVIPRSSLYEIARRMPASVSGLASVKGMGKKRISMYGSTLMALMDEYLKRPASTPDVQAAKKSTRELTLEIYLNNPGCSIETLAALRGLSQGTVSEHLAAAVEEGRIGISELVDAHKRQMIEEYFESVDDDRLGPAREVLGEEFSWIELRLVRAALRHKARFKNNTAP